MANLRFEVVAEAFKKRPVEVETPKVRPSEYFAKYVFNRQKMYKYLPSDVYEKLIDVIDNGNRLDRSIADAVAAGMKLWAEENGVTHYTHWFQPLTEGTAEKHDAFVEHDGKGGMIEEFSCSRSRMPALSLTAVSVTPSRLAAILHGILHRLCSSSTIPSVSLPSLYLIQVRRWTTRLHCSDRSIP